VSAGDAITDVLEIRPLGKELPGPVTLEPRRSATLGRDPDCQIVVHDESISRRHAEVRCTDGGWCVLDLGSHNGTRINGWKIDADVPVILHDGDELGLAGARFQVSICSERAATALDSQRPGPPATYATRASIFERLRSPDDVARELGWEEFRRRYAPVILGYCRNAGLRAQDAEDILQEVMLGFFRAASEFRYQPERGRFRGYLKRATHNAIRTLARRSDAARAVSESFLDAQVGAADDPWDRQWAEQILARALEEVQQRVDSQTFEAFELYARRGVPVEVVAERLELSPQSVYQAKSRVLRLVEAISEHLRATEE
jgi:RNA polymerase sigma-70 factor, ECF subfamily